jgi:hypothetical protein
VIVPSEKDVHVEPIIVGDHPPVEPAVVNVSLTPLDEEPLTLARQRSTATANVAGDFAGQEILTAPPADRLLLLPDPNVEKAPFVESVPVLVFP